MNQIPIMLVDDNRTFLRVTAEFLESHDDVVVVGTASEGREALALVHELNPRVILIDLAMRGMPGLEAIPLLRETLPKVNIIALTVMNAQSFRQAALSVGADAFISKANMRTDLLPAIRRLAENNGDKPAETAAPTPESEPSPHRILVVEDEAALRRLYAKALNAAGYEIHTAGTLQEARDLLSQVRFDLLLCDIHMGDGRGTELLDDYSEQLFTSGAQVIMVSGQVQYRDTCREMGADFFLEKPVSVSTLVALVGRLTARHSFQTDN